MSSVSGAADGIAADGGSPEAEAADWVPVAGSRARAAQPRAGESDLFTRSVLDYARQQGGGTVKILQAGCSSPPEDLDLARLRSGRVAVAVRGIDQDHPLTRKITQFSAGQGSAGQGSAGQGSAGQGSAGQGSAGQGGAVPFALGDLRTLPLPPREFDVVCSSHLLDRLEHAELILDRLVAALRPGGLLLLRFRDRDCAAALLDRMLPGVARRTVWHWLRPRQAGPFPAVYERLLSADGVYAFVLARGLVVAQRQALRDRPRRPARLAWGAPLACRLIAVLSRGKRTDDHDDLLFVIRKPESRFARVL